MAPKSDVVSGHVRPAATTYARMFEAMIRETAHKVYAVRCWKREPTQKSTPTFVSHFEKTVETSRNLHCYVLDLQIAH